MRSTQQSYVCSTTVVVSDPLKFRNNCVYWYIVTRFFIIPFVSHLRSMDPKVVTNPTCCNVVILLVVTKDLPITPRFSPTIFYRDNIQVQHSCTSSTDGWIAVSHVVTLSATNTIINKRNHPVENRTHDISTQDMVPPRYSKKI